MVPTMNPSDVGFKSGTPARASGPEIRSGAAEGVVSGLEGLPRLARNL